MFIDDYLLELYGQQANYKRLCTSKEAESRRKGIAQERFESETISLAQLQQYFHNIAAADSTLAREELMDMDSPAAYYNAQQ